MAAIPLIRRSALHAFHLAEASMIEDHGWQCADSYGSVEAEVQAIREQVGLSDISPLAKLDIQGNDVLAALGQKLSLGLSLGLSLETVPVGRAVRIPAQALNAQTDGLLCSLTGNHARLISPPGTAGAVHTRVESVIQQTADSACIHLTDVTSNFTARPDRRSAQSGLCCGSSQPWTSGPPNSRICPARKAVWPAFILWSFARTFRRIWPTKSIVDGSLGNTCGTHLLDAGQEFGARPFGLAAQRQLHAQG